MNNFSLTLPLQTNPSFYSPGREGSEELLRSGRCPLWLLKG